MIPDEAVVAATKVLFADNISNHAGDTAPQIIDACEKVARTALEAAAPFMLGRVQVGDVEVIAPDVTRVGDTISYNGELYVRATETP